MRYRLAFLGVVAAVACAFAPRGNAQPLSYQQLGKGAVSRPLAEKAMEVASVKDYGAVGDGAADDTVAIQSAIDSHAVVFFPAGSYVVKGVTIRKGTTGMIIFGAGKSATTIVNLGAGAAISSIGDGIRGNWNIHIRDLSIKGHGASGHGVFFDYTYHSTIERVETFGHGADGIRIQRGFYNDVVSCWSHGNLGSGLFLGRIANANNVFGGHYRINRAAGIRISPESDRERSHGNSIFGATIEGNETYGVDIVDSDENRLIGMYLESSTAFRTLAQVRITGEMGSANFNVIEGANFAGDVLSILLDRARDTVVKSSSINYGLTINQQAQRTRLIGNARLQGKLTDASETTTMFNDPVNGAWYARNGATKGYELIVGGAATVNKFGDNYLRYDFTSLQDAFRFRTLTVGGVPLPVMHFGAYRVWINPESGKLYVNKADPRTTTDGTQVGIQEPDR